MGYRKNGSRNLFDRSITTSDTPINDAANACSENENNEVLLLRYRPIDGGFLTDQQTTNSSWWQYSICFFSKSYEL